MVASMFQKDGETSVARAAAFKVVSRRAMTIACFDQCRPQKLLSTPSSSPPKKKLKKVAKTIDRPESN